MALCLILTLIQKSIKEKPREKAALNTTLTK